MSKQISTYLILCSAISGLLLCSKTVNAHDDILISHVGDQWTFEGARLPVFVHVIHAELEGFDFVMPEAPDFVTIRFEDGRAAIIVDAPIGSAGVYQITLEVSKGQQLTRRQFQLEIKRPPAQVFYVGGVTLEGSDGSLEHPWVNIEPLRKLTHSKTPVLVLFKSMESNKLIFNESYESNIYIMPMIGATVSVDHIIVKNAMNLTIKGLRVNGHHEERILPFVTIDEISYKIEVSNCEIGHSDIAADWTEMEWKTQCRDGIFSRGDSISLLNNLISYTYHSLDTRGNKNTVAYNIIDRFAGDAIRNTGSKSVFNFNTMKNAVIADYDEPGGNHDDLYQSWTFEDPIVDVTLSNNIAVAYCDNTLKFPSKVVQGLVCFDGFTENWTIENNLVLVDHPHGITLLGARNCRIINNTVSKNPRQLQTFESEPWIMVEKHKNGQSGESNVIRNNIASVLMIGNNEGLVDHNITGSDYSSLFNAAGDWNFRLKPSSSATDAGSDTLAPSIDLVGHKRPAGKAWDAGCFELEN